MFTYTRCGQPFDTITQLLSSPKHTLKNTQMVYKVIAEHIIIPYVAYEFSVLRTCIDIP